jgi:hypothetical protein
MTVSDTINIFVTISSKTTSKVGPLEDNHIKTFFEIGFGGCHTGSPAPIIPILNLGIILNLLLI